MEITEGEERETSLTVQRLEVYLPMQETRVQSLIQEDQPRGNEACVPQLLTPCSRAWETQR